MRYTVSSESSGGVGAGASVVQSRGVGERGCIIVLRGRLVASLARPQGGLPQIARSSSLVGGHPVADPFDQAARSEEHTSELQSLMRISYAVFCLKKKT